MEILQIVIIFGIIGFIVWFTNKHSDKSELLYEGKSNIELTEKKEGNDLNIIRKLKQIPRQNYHVLGYITFFYFLYIVHESWNYGMNHEYYEILRWIVTCFSVWTIIRIFHKNPQSYWILIFGTIAILFNPIAKISLYYEVWQKVDIATILVFLIYAIKNKPKFE